MISHLPKRHPDKTTQVFFFSPLQSCSPNLVTTNKIAKRFITYYIYYFSFGFYQIYKFDLSWGFQGVRLSLLWHFQRFGLSTGDPWLPLSLSLVGVGEWRIPAMGGWKRIIKPSKKIPIGWLWLGLSWFATSQSSSRWIGSDDDRSHEGNHRMVWCLSISYTMTLANTLGIRLLSLAVVPSWWSTHVMFTFCLVELAADPFHHQRGCRHCHSHCRHHPKHDPRHHPKHHPKTSS